MLIYSAEHWMNQLSAYKKEADTFVSQAKKTLNRYENKKKDENSSVTKQPKFNILWSNIQTLTPAIYSKVPSVDVSRRNQDKNDAARVASMILQRVIQFEITKKKDYHDALSQALNNRLIVGRGTAWIRYEPKLEKTVDEFGQEFESISSENCPIDFVNWQDFAHSVARTWDEVEWVARRTFLTKQAGIERFGDIFESVPLTASDSQDNDSDNKNDDNKDANKKAIVWEIWCKTTKKAYWLADSKKILDEKDDPLQLEDFFPCPKPLNATTTTSSIIPICDFTFYKDQADEIDKITSRIYTLTNALKVIGFYAADEQAIKQLETAKPIDLIPITNWPSWSEKGGIGGAVQFMSLIDIVNALKQLYAARESAKQIIYEITGISDILRGSSVASETATAQQIKSQYASLRLNEMKDDFARFAQELLRIKAEIICQFYQPQTLIDVSGILNTPDGQNQELIASAIELIKNERTLNWNIEIDSDSLVQANEQEEKQNRIEFLTAVSGFIEKAVEASQLAPQLSDLMINLLMFGVRGFKIGRELEGVLEDTLNQFNQQKNTQQQPGAINDEQQKAQQEIQQNMQLEQMKMQHEIHIQQLKAQSEMQIEKMKQEFENERERERLINLFKIEELKCHYQSTRAQHTDELTRSEQQL